MPDMTEEEYDALDELWTKNPPKVSGDGKNGFFMQHKNEIVILDDVSATWLRLKSETTKKTTTEIIGEMVREHIAAAV
jgi:SRSO17 transposase